MSGAAPEDPVSQRLLHDDLRQAGQTLQAEIAGLARLAAQLSGCPFGWLAIIRGTSNQTLGVHGFETHQLSDATCIHQMLAASDGLIVGDCTHGANWMGERPRMSGQPIRALAGLAFRIGERATGIVCAFDTQPHPFDAGLIDGLRDIAQAAATLLESQVRESRWRAEQVRIHTATRFGNDWLWETDAQGRITWVFASAPAHAGWPVAQDIGQTIADIHRPSGSDLAGSWTRYETAWAARAPFRDLVAERHTPNGMIVVSISGMPVFDAQGIFSGYRGACSDITAHIQRAEQAKHLLSDALDSLTAGVMITNPDGRVALANPVWRNNLGPYLDADLTWPETVRRMAEEGAYPDVRDRDAFVRWRLSLATRRGEPHEIRWRDRYLLISDRLLADGSIVHLSVDISDRKNTELALTERQAELTQSQARLRAVLDAVPDRWRVLGESGHCLESSLQDDGATQGADPHAGGLSPSLIARVQPVIARALSSGELQRFQYDLTANDGTQRAYEVRISPMPNRQVLYVTRDLTELRNLARDVSIMQRALEADASLPICVCNAMHPEMPLIYVNPAFERLTGYHRSELLGRNCRLLQGGLEKQPALATLREALRQGVAVSVTLNNVRKDGSGFSNALHVAPVRDAAGVLTHYIGVLRDVTEQTRAADKLRLSEELYRSVASAISDGLLVVTPALAIIAINPAACDILGVAQLAMTGSRDWPFRLLDENEQPLAPAQLPVARVMSTQRPLLHQIQPLDRPDGQRRWIELNAHPLQLRPEGETFAVVLTFRDITQQRAAENALAAAEERWKFALEGAGDGVWDWDMRANKYFYSTRWKEMRGYADHEIGDTIDEWTSRVHPDDLPRVQAQMSRHLRGETPFYEVEYRVLHRLGHELWIRDRGKTVRYGPDGRADRLVGTQTDITRGKQAEEMQRDKRAAELASNAKSEFLSRMSHEMRTPLNAVLGFSHLLHVNPAQEALTVREYAGHVLDAGRHLLALIDDVLDLQKIEEGALSLKLEPLDLHDAVTHALELLWPAAQPHQVELSNQVPARTWVLADPQRLRQVLLNVGSNAIKYNRPSGCVRWRQEAAMSGRVTLCIEDEGPGMSPEQMSRLFQPFERLGRETSTIEGTGLGLIIARSLVQAIGGHISITSEEGRGTCVNIDLQQSDEPAHVPAPTRLEASASPQGVLRMLYVEDNRINAILFEEAVRMHSSGIELRIAEDGDEAIEVATNWTPDVLVLDAHLPGITGFEVLSQLRTLPGLSHAPAYMCSADAMPDDIQRAYEAGFVGYWTKPINVAAVMADIDQWIQRASPPPPADTE